MPHADTERIVCISNVVNAAENKLYFDLFMQSTMHLNHNRHVKTSVTCRLKKKKRSLEVVFVPCCDVFLVMQR